MLSGVVGDLGSGKTITLTFIGYVRMLENFDVYSNYGLTFPHFRVKSFNDFDEMRNGVFLGDDFWSWLDAHFSGSVKNRFGSAVLLKSRKRQYDVFYSSQHALLVDWRLETITNFYYFPLYITDKLCWVDKYSKYGALIDSFIFKPYEMFDKYDTTEEVKDIEIDDVDLMRVVNKLFLDKRFKVCKSKTSRLAYIHRFYRQSKDDCYLILDFYVERLNNDLSDTKEVLDNLEWNNIIKDGSLEIKSLT